VIRTVSSLLLLAAATAPLTAQSTLRVDGANVPIERVQGYRLISAAALTSLGAQLQYEGWRAQLRLFGDTITFYSHSPFLRIRGHTDQLVSPTILSGSTLWLPIQFFTEWLPAIYSTRLTYRDGALSRVAVAARPAARSPRVVVLDPGHGGKDPGKPGPNGLLEKNAALAVTQRLAGFLRERGYEVHLTRARDTLISLADRPHLANEWKNGRPAAVFISIHANSGVRGSSGFETYFLSSARTDDERRVAEMENAAVEFEERKSSENAPELDLILSGLKNDFYQRASNSLAELIQTNLAAVHPGPNRGVKQAGFRVLVGAVMPAVLVEMGFISNEREARLLGTSAFQQKVAWSLAQAVDRFFAAHEPLFINASVQ
jgi:N-acetylmuramoyl-L-alanine amidase